MAFIINIPSLPTFQMSFEWLFTVKRQELNRKSWCDIENSLSQENDDLSVTSHLRAFDSMCTVSETWPQPFGILNFNCM